MSNMKVWECKNNEVVLMVPDDWEIESYTVRALRPTENSYTTTQSSDQLFETARYEITERKPDYEAMAARRQFGKFDFETASCYGWLFKYDSEDTEGVFHGCDTKGDKDHDISADAFTPCAEPAELDPITMLPKEPL